MSPGHRRRNPTRTRVGNGPPGDAAPGLAGDTALLGLWELLQIAGFNHLSGVFTLETSGGGTAWLALRDGRIVDAAADDARGEDALEEILAVEHGRFTLQPLPEGAATPLDLPLGQVLMRAAMKLPPPDPDAPVDPSWRVEGDAALLGVQEMLQIFEANRRPARLALEGSGGAVELVLAEGRLVSATGPSGAGPEAVYGALCTSPKTLRAEAAPGLDPPAKLYDIASLLMEGLRRRDEARLVEEESRPADNVHAEEMLAAYANGELAPLERKELARRYLPGGAVTPADVLARLTVDPDAEVRAAAVESVDDLPEAVRAALARDPETPRPLLRYFLVAHPKDEALRSALFENPALPAGALAEAAPTLQAHRVAALAERDDLLAHAPLRAALRAHPDCRFVEKLDRLDAEAAPQRLKKIPFGAPAPKPAAPADAAPAAEKEPAEEVVVLAAPERDERVEKVEKRPTMGDLLLLAMKGSLRERVKLTQHPLDTVAENVLDSPGIPDVAIEGIAQSTSTNPVCFKQIGNNPRWAKMAGVVQALLFNPKCPPSVTRAFVPMQRDNTLEKIASNRELPDGLRQLARKRLDRKKH